MAEEFHYDDEDEVKDKDNSNEPAEDQSMADAFDFDVPEGDPDDLSDLGDDDDSAQGKAGDDKDSAGDDDKDKDDKPAEKEVIDPKLMVRAGRMNLSDEDTEKVLSLGSNEAISGMLDLLEKQKVSSEGEGEKKKAPEWYEISEEAAEDMAPELVEELKKISGSTKEAVEQLLGGYEGQIKDLKQTLAEQGMNAFDDAVEALGKDWTPVFGKEGKTDSGHERNLERLRKAVFSDVYKGSVARRVKTAISDMFAEHSNKLAKNANVEKARNRQGRFIGKPSQRSMSNADLSPRQRAVKNVTKGMREKGIHPDQLESFDYNEIL